VDLVEMSRTSGLSHKLPNALIQSAVEHRIRARDIGSPLIFQRRPLSKNSRRIEIDVRHGVAIGLIVPMPSLSSSWSSNHWMAVRQRYRGLSFFAPWYSVQRQHHDVGRMVEARPSQSELSWCPNIC
jgi:hypothetical protein